MAKKVTKDKNDGLHISSLIITGIVTCVLGYNLNQKLSGDINNMSVEAWGLLTGIGFIIFICGLFGMIFSNKEQMVFYAIGITASCLSLLIISIPYFVESMKTGQPFETLTTFVLIIVSLSSYALISVVGVLKFFNVFDKLFPKSQQI